VDAQDVEAQEVDARRRGIAHPMPLHRAYVERAFFCEPFTTS
jgi:hypothetical protein